MFKKVILSLALMALYGCGKDEPLATINDPCEHEEVTCVSEVPEFSQYVDVKEKKKAFFDFLYPIVADVNNIVLEERERAKAIFSKPAEKLSEEEQEWLLMLAEAYALELQSVEEVYQQKNELLSRIDIVPPSMALAQSAKESGWGGSRFAEKANNLFGQWCFEKGCGVVPKSRSKNAIHEIRSFDSVNRSVASYVRNINKHPSYSDLRSMRKTLRDSAGQFIGPQIVPGLRKYSERGEIYVTEVQSLIKANKLAQLDEKYWQEVGERSK